MSLDDVRVLWLRDRALALLGLSDPAPFEELLSRAEDARVVLLFFGLGAEDERGAGTALLLLRAERAGPDGEEGTGEGSPAPGPAWPQLPVSPSLKPLFVPSAESEPHDPRLYPFSCLSIPWAVFS